MISITKANKRIMRCLSCYSNNEVFDVSIGLDEKQVSTILLCRKCLDKLSKKIKSYK